jgi:hypothetical protein
MGSAIGFRGDLKLRAVHRHNCRGGLNLETRGHVAQAIHAVVHVSQPLVKDDDLAAAVSPGMCLGNGDVGFGSQIGSASVEEDQCSGGGWAGADPISCLDPVTHRWESPDFAPERQDFYRTVHLGQGDRLGDGPAKPSQQQQTAEDERDQGEHRFQSWLQGGHVPGHGGSLGPLSKNGGN